MASKAKKKLPPITPKQERFCREYLVDMNGTAAAKRAGYSERTANEQASRLLTYPGISARIKELKEAQFGRLDLKADDILRELLLIARADIFDAFEENGRVKPIRDIPEALRRAIAGVEVTTMFAEGVDIGDKTKLKFWDKTRALELLAKHLKLLNPTIEHTGTVTLAEIVAGSREDEE